MIMGVRINHRVRMVNGRRSALLQYGSTFCTVTQAAHAFHCEISESGQEQGIGVAVGQVRKRSCAPMLHSIPV